jgi:hypothetical protein
VDALHEILGQAGVPTANCRCWDEANGVIKGR